MCLLLRSHPLFLCVFTCLFISVLSCVTFCLSAYSFSCLLSSLSVSTVMTWCTTVTPTSCGRPKPWEITSSSECIQMVGLLQTYTHSDRDVSVKSVFDQPEYKDVSHWLLQTKTELSYNHEKNKVLLVSYCKICGNFQAELRLNGIQM